MVGIVDTLIQEQNKKTCCREQETSKAPSLVKFLVEVWTSYKPLIAILSFCILLSAAQNASEDHEFMPLFMGYFFIFLSLFKFFDLKGFVDGFSTYDLITKRRRAYGYAYPFIELALGLAYIINCEPFLINWITVAVMGLSGMGVLNSILSGHKLRCACLGTALNVPLSAVSFLENFGMGAMAVYYLATV